MKTQRDTHLIPGLLTALLGGFLLWKGVLMPHDRGWSSSPGLFPIIIGAVLILLALLLMIERRKLHKASAPPSDAAGDAPLDLKVVGMVAGSLAIYILALGHMPYEPPTFVYLVFAMWAFGNRSVLSILGTSLAFTLLISVLFTQVLGTLVPGSYSLLEVLLY